MPRFYIDSNIEDSAGLLKATGTESGGIDLTYFVLHKIEIDAIGTVGYSRALKAPALTASINNTLD